MNAALRTDRRCAAGPDRNDEYLYYQALLSVWPAGARDGAPIPPELPDGLSSRLSAF